MGVRKMGRHKTRSPSAKAYVAEGRLKKNKAKKIAKHMLNHPNDKTNHGEPVNYGEGK